MTDHATRIAFITELRDLLKRYDAEISVEYDACSDLQGVSGEAMSVSMGKADRFQGRPTFSLGEGWGIEPEGLSKLLDSNNQ